MDTKIHSNENDNNFEEIVFGNLLRAADAVKRKTEEFLKKGDITLLQYNVLRTVREFGSEGAPTQKIAQHMLNKVPDITRLIDRIIKKGLVSRKRSLEDRRGVRVIITQKGLKIANEFEIPLVEFHRQNFYELLTKKELKTLNIMLSEIKNKM